MSLRSISKARVLRGSATGCVLAVAIGLLAAAPTVAQQYAPSYGGGGYPAGPGYAAPGCPCPSGAGSAPAMPYYTPSPGQQPYVTPSPGQQGYPTPAPGQPSATTPSPSQMPQQQPSTAPSITDELDAAMAPDLANLAGAAGSAMAQGSVTPEMMGDRFGTAGTYLEYFDPYSSEDRRILIPNSATGGVVGRLKLSENTSPMPRDRVFFNYSYFDDVPLLIDGVNVERYTVGIEKTFFCGAMSVEVKAPVACTLDNEITLRDDNDTSDYVFGNLYTTVKCLLARGDDAGISMGVTVEIPTADDIVIEDVSGGTLIDMENNSVHLAPFVGMLWDPGDFFAQCIIQWDIDTTGSQVYMNTDPAFPSFGSLERVGRITDATWQYNDLSLGYWLFQSCDPCAALNGLAVITEVHYNVTLNHEDEITANGVTLGQRAHRDNLNVVVGLAARVNQNLSMGIGYGLPIGNGSDQEFDGEVRMFLNYYFGRTGGDSVSMLD